MNIRSGYSTAYIPPSHVNSHSSSLHNESGFSRKLDSLVADSSNELPDETPANFDGVERIGNQVSIYLQGFNSDVTSRSIPDNLYFMRLTASGIMSNSRESSVPKLNDGYSNKAYIEAEHGHQMQPPPRQELTDSRRSQLATRFSIKETVIPEQPNTKYYDVSPSETKIIRARNNNHFTEKSAPRGKRLLTIFSSDGICRLAIRDYFITEKEAEKLASFVMSSIGGPKSSSIIFSWNGTTKTT